MSERLQSWEMSAGGRRVGAFIAKWVGAAGCEMVDWMTGVDGSNFQSSNSTLFLVGGETRPEQIVRK